MAAYKQGVNHDNLIMNRVVQHVTPKQKQDLELIISLADEMVASALASRNGEQSYMNFLHARETFIGTLLQVAENYVRIDPT